MTDQEFEKKWKENREKILSNDSHYQSILRSYNSWGWIDYVIFILGFVICEAFLEKLTTMLFLQYLLAIIGMFLIWLGYRFLKSMLQSKETLAEYEAKLKQQYYKSLKQ